MTNASELNGNLILLGLDLAANGTSASFIVGAQSTRDGMYRECRDNAVLRVANCPPASLFAFALTLNGTEFVGVDQQRNDTTRFRVAKSGNAQIYLRAGASITEAGAQRFRIALSENMGLGNATFFGADTNGSFGAVTLTPSTYSFSGVSVNGANATDSIDPAVDVIGPGNSAVMGLKVGSLTRTPINAFFTRADPLFVLVTARGSAGYMQIGAQ